MEEKEFNLLDEPWICVIDSQCNVKELSMLELFEHAHEYVDFSGETTAQDIAVLRLLLAILHTVFHVMTWKAIHVKFVAKMMPLISGKNFGKMRNSR